MMNQRANLLEEITQKYKGRRLQEPLIVGEQEFTGYQFNEALARMFNNNCPAVLPIFFVAVETNRTGFPAGPNASMMVFLQLPISYRPNMAFENEYEVFYNEYNNLNYVIANLFLPEGNIDEKKLFHAISQVKRRIFARVYGFLGRSAYIYGDMMVDSLAPRHPDQITDLDIITGKDSSVIDSATYEETGIPFAVQVPDGVRRIKSEAFLHGHGMEYVFIPGSITEIEDAAFADCGSLVEIKIPNGVTTIGDEAFRYCHNLADVVIPQSVTQIGDFAFSECQRMCRIGIPSSVTSIGQGAFDGCSLLAIVTPRGSYAEHYALQNDIPYIYE